MIFWFGFLFYCMEVVKMVGAGKILIFRYLQNAGNNYFRIENNASIA